MSRRCNLIPIVNPFLGKPAYVTASEPCRKVCQPCELQTGVAPPDPPPEPVEPLTPECVEVVFATDSSWVRAVYAWDEASSSYIPADPALPVGTYNSTLGWVFGGFNTGSPSLDPRNSYSSGTDVMALGPCGSVPPDPPVFPECVQTVYADDPTVVLGQFQEVPVGSGTYVADGAGQGSLAFNTTLGWQINAGSATYQGSTDHGSVMGSYTAADGRVILVHRCVDPPPPDPIPPNTVTCVRTVYRDDAAIPLGSWNAMSETQYTPPNSTFGSLTYSVATGWRYVFGAATYQGSMALAEPVGIYTNTAGQQVVFLEC